MDFSDLFRLRLKFSNKLNFTLDASVTRHQAIHDDYLITTKQEHGKCKLNKNLCKRLASS